jgi:alanine racemase
MYIDVSSLEEVKIGDEVVLLVDGVEAEIVAEFSGTIADDIISKISPRIERVFIKERSSE